MLSPTLTRLNAVAMVVGTIIGASIFVQPSEIARHLATPAEIMLVWLACGVVTLFGAFVCAELASAFPQTGGLYVFLRETFSPLAGFLWGWAMFWSVHSGIVAAIAMVFARYSAQFVPVGDAGIRTIAVATIVGVSALSYAGVRASARAQTVLTVVKVTAIVGLVVVGLAVAATRTLPTPLEAGAPVGTSGFLLAMVAGLFAYGGWHIVTYTAGETMMPTRTIPFALVAGVAVVTACYVALNEVYLLLLPIETVRGSTRIAADAADAVAGRGGASFMAALVMLSSFGGLIGLVLSGPRVYYSMATDGLAFRWLGRVHPRYNTPSNAIVVQGVWASVLAATGAYRELFTRVIYTEWIFFAAMAAGLMILRRRPEYRPLYRVWGYPLVPIVFIAASIVIVVMQIMAVPRDSMIGLGMVLLGLPVYVVWSKRR
jgi:basic amino acid/polyamine antiporter, APA family